MRTVRFVFNNRELICSSGKSLPWLMAYCRVISIKNPAPILHMRRRVTAEPAPGKRRVLICASPIFYRIAFWWCVAFRHDC